MFATIELQKPGCGRPVSPSASSEALGQVPGGSGLGVNAEDHGSWPMRWSFLYRIPYRIMGPLTEDAPISFGRGPRRCEDFFVFHRELELQSLALVGGVGRPPCTDPPPPRLFSFPPRSQAALAASATV